MSAPNTFTGAASPEASGGFEAGEVAPFLSPPKVGDEAGRANETRFDGAGGDGVLSPAPTGPTLDRRTYLGASDIGAIVGLNPWKSALDVWAEKCRGLTIETTPVMRAGQVLERPILEELYAAPRGLVLAYPGTLRHPVERWMAATPDAIETDLAVDVQCKLVGRGQFARWSDEGEGPDGIPPEVLAQIQWEIQCADAVSGRAVALLGTELRVYDVPRDDAFAADLMELGRAWWKRHVIGDEMPEVTAASRDTLRRLFPRATGALLTMREDVRDLALDYQRAREAAALADEAKEAASARLCAAIGDAQGFEATDLTVTWKEQRGRIGYGELVKSLGIPAAQQEPFRGAAFRVLRVHSKGEE